MGLDIRLPIGLMFLALGFVLVLSGLVLGSDLYQRSLGINVNLWWGLVMVVFGAFMLVFGLRGGSTAKLTEDSPEGRKIEEFEHDSGLESTPGE